VPAVFGLLHGRGKGPAGAVKAQKETVNAGA